jgi:hypothetical protein
MIDFLARTNWGRFFALSVSALQAAAGIGYFFRGNIRMGALWSLWAITSLILAY